LEYEIHIIEEFARNGYFLALEQDMFRQCGAVQDLELHLPLSQETDSFH
jgi:hypothetical protein